MPEVCFSGAIQKSRLVLLVAKWHGQVKVVHQEMNVYAGPQSTSHHTGTIVQEN